MAELIARGERSVSPETAVRILRDIKPVLDDFDEFTEVTHLDELLKEVSEALRIAGPNSRFSVAFRMIWAGGATHGYRRLAETEAVRTAVPFLRARPERKEALVREIVAWSAMLGLRPDSYLMDELGKQGLGPIASDEYDHTSNGSNLRIALEHHQKLHQHIIDIGLSEAVEWIEQDARHIPLPTRFTSSYKDETRFAKYVLEQALLTQEDTLDDYYDQFFRDEERRAQLWSSDGYYPMDDEIRIYELHRSIVLAITSGEAEKATELIWHHFYWLWQ